ncbi:MAG: glycosyltransferase family 4 protein [Ignavibacterium sp.]|nr:glycosyltransferase family 4 protein [Ignavibacterium sp.]MDW8375972.1 glycosyltransferase family 4 protein [Ignavibacteriales bacterium]
MNDELNILHISPNFNFVCGVSKYIYTVLKAIKSFENENRIKLFFITNGGDGLARLESIGVKVYIMKFGKGIRNILYLKKNLVELEKFCLFNDIKIIHSHHRYPELLANSLKRKLNVKTITTVHSLVDGFKRLSFQSDKIIAVSKAVEKNLIEKFKVNRTKIYQIYNPIDINYDKNENDNSIRSKLNIPDDAVVFLFIGRWSKIKGVDILIKVFNKISEENKNISLILISDVKDKTQSYLNNKCKNLIFIKPQENINYFYKLSDIVILPSKKESFPYVMLEAGLHKKLFLGSKVGGIAEFIEDRVDGFLFEPNYHSLKKLVKEVLDKKLYKIDLMKESLNKKVISLYDSETYVKKLIDIYYSL